MSKTCGSAKKPSKSLGKEVTNSDFEPPPTQSTSLRTSSRLRKMKLVAEGTEKSSIEVSTPMVKRIGMKAKEKAPTDEKVFSLFLYLVVLTT
ncbi:hypothetical protein PanWU01x14_047500 [Parasponia andersonii]|uniref:Uncharacterized protein n=1 Tax=Parasponia andersonii TaxID=3476 RepID=A0A2P5DN28_PARAD|nr:hypothetical protein PanWU01x14_047500 [Parasponia andersonii]